MPSPLLSKNEITAISYTTASCHHASPEGHDFIDVSLLFTRSRILRRARRLISPEKADG
jgi:hypothetical protein